MLIILIQPLSVASYILVILGLMVQQLYIYILMCQLIRKYTQIARSSLYRRQYSFSLYIFQICLLYTSSCSAIIRYSFRLKLLNKGCVTLQFKYLQLYYTIVNPFIAYLVTYKCLLFIFRVSQAELQQLRFSAGMGLQPHWYCLMGVLCPILLLVGQLVLRPGWVPQLSFVKRLFTRLYLPCLSPSPYRRFPIAQP